MAFATCWPATPKGPASLSDRERQVTALAASGRHNKLIAYELGLSPATVRVLMARAAAKLGVASRDELVERYRQHLTSESRSEAP